MKQKKVYIEILRLIAIFLVLYTHTGQRGVWHFQIAENMPSYWIGMSMACIDQMCVQLFFLITGAVLLHKEETIGQVMKKRFLPMVIVVMIFGMLQYFLNYLKAPEIGFDLRVYFKMIYSHNVITQYWFLRTYLGFLLILPLLRILVKYMKKEHFYYFFGIYAVVYGVLPILERIWENDALRMDFPLFDSIIVFSMLGYFLEHVLKEELMKMKALCIVNGMGILAFVAYLSEANIHYRETGNLLILNGCLLLMAAALYTDIKWFCKVCKLPKWLQNTLIFLGSGSFGVYLLEPQVREYTMVIYDLLVTKITWLGAIFPWLFTAMLIGILFMNILKSIPVVKKLF